MSQNMVLMIMAAAAQSKFILNIVFDACIAVALLLFFLIVVRAVMFNGEWKGYSKFGKILTIVFLVFILLVMVALFFIMMRTGNE